ncbi:MAG TPA: polysaccharide deacetylase family protein [Candidatus Paceibacterota bacterium]|nr:polysaccharide deacetylase family protein [Verrucomicrobiota bacterium]HRY49134.1 polysaccharide deacetylase family protein [Candidatus Paceibacterota bacterium]HRZ99838.1 polysaccharide deacetylase family protein [Candidatus Paceibacterota bacterium]
MKLLPILFVLCCLSIPGMAETNPNLTLAEKLGYKAQDRLLIINGDDAGMCHTANEATIECLEKGLMTSATLMAPCPWFNEMASYARSHPEKDFGVHLCHTCEWKPYRWGSVAPSDKVSGLLDPQGYLWPSVQEVYEHAKPEQALWEARAQIKKTLDAGVDVTHLDSHMGTLQLNPQFMEVYVALALEFRLPLRMASQETLAGFGYPEMRSQLSRKGIVFPDHFVYEELKAESAGVKQFWMNILSQLKPGVTELYIHAGKPTEELKAITGSWKTRSEEFETFTHDPDIRKVIQEKGIIRIGYRPLRELQRQGK